MATPDRLSRQLILPVNGVASYLEIDDLLRRVITDHIARSALSHEQVADQLGAALGWRVTPHILACWRAESKKKYHIPATAIVALCRILATDDPIQVLARALGGKFLAGRALACAELAFLEDEQTQLLQQIERRRRLLRDQEG